MNNSQQKSLGATLWGIADKLRGAMNVDDFCDYMQCEEYISKVKSANKSKDDAVSTGKEIADYLSIEQLEENLRKIFAADSRDSNEITILAQLSVWYAQNLDAVVMFEKQMRRKLHYVIKPYCVDHYQNNVNMR